jgi:hypothetical protein
MRALIAVSALLLVTACGSDADTANDAGGSAPPKPTGIPAADGPVVGLGMVLDGSADGATGFCLGPVAESYPPQCDGMPLTGWDWADHEGDYDDGSELKFGTFAVTGTFDGTTLTAQSAVPGALYDPMPWPEPTSSAAKDHSDTELQAIADELTSLPGALTTMPGDNLVVLDVVHDDGTIQDWVDAEYGEGLVFVHSALASADG